MRKFTEIISSQLVSKSLLSARPFRFFDEEQSGGEFTNRDTRDMASESGRAPADAPHHRDTQVHEAPSSQPVAADISYLSQYNDDDKKADILTKVEALQIKLLRLVHRIGLSPENVVVAQALYRLQLAGLIRDGESDSKRPTLKIHRAKAIAVQKEVAGQTDLEFSFKVLVLGKTGVGKSTTINSIFGQTKTDTDAFQPATDRIQEVVGNIRGIKVSVIDTPGLLPSPRDQGKNRRILLEVKHFIRKSSPDIILYFERLDFINKDNNDYPLLKLITDVFGSSIWFNTIMVMTHSSSSPPEGPDGYPVSYEAFVSHCTNLLQHQIHRAVSSIQIENPIILVENHPMCRRNMEGEMVLPNGQVWMSQFLLLCIVTKVLGDANSLLKFQDTIQLTTPSTRVPSLPELLSSFLRPRSLANEGSSDESVEVLDNEEEEYDQLPPIRILTKAQYKKLSKTQKNAYLDELDYRETLYLKKQWKEELRRRHESLTENKNMLEGDDGYDSKASDDTEWIDFPLPQNLDSDNLAYRYRCLMSDGPWVVRPVLDPQGWDHDIGFDGISYVASADMKRNVRTSITGEMRKDKEDLNIRSECGVQYMDPKGHSALAGMDIQAAGKDMICTVHGGAKFRNLHCNSTGGTLSLTSFGKMRVVGAMLEDSVSIGRRFMLTMNTVRLVGCGQTAHGAGLEATFRGRDYPVRDEKLTLAATLVSSDKEAVLGGNLQLDFRVGRNTKLSVNGNMNRKNSGQMSLRISTSDHAEIALIGVISLLQALCRRMKLMLSGDGDEVPA